ncbi:MAG: ribbon-helix-helix protein, CopG family [Burkholderiales bacterium]
MSTTTLRLPDQLKDRLSRLAEAEGTSAHALMVEMLSESAQAREARADFHAEAQRRLRRMARTGEYLELDDLRSYATALARGEQPISPKPRRMSKDDQAALKASLRRRTS